MNFYEFYRLLKENTVSQELKKFKQNNYLKNKNIVNTLIEEIKKVMFPQHILPNINQNSKNSISNWILLNYLKENNKDTSWLNWLDNIKGKIEQRNAQTSIDILQYNLESYLRKKRIHQYYDYIAYNLDNNGNLIGILENKFNNPSFTINDLKVLSDQYHQEISFGRGNIPGASGKTILSFPDGYKWVDLNKDYCEREGRAGLHCGNVGRQPGDTILSLRDSRDLVYLTFVLNNGVLVERKAKQNLKPKSKYHPYIIELLKLPIIKNIDLIGRYDPANDFQLNDLSEKQLENLLKAKPEFQETLKLYSTVNKIVGEVSTKEKLTQEEIISLVNSDIENYKKQLVNYINLRKDHEISTETLKSLAKDKQINIRLALANVMYLPNEIYEILSKDNDSTVKMSVGVNPSAPQNILDYLSKDEKAEVRMGIASNYYTNKETLDELSNDEDERVRYRVARNSNTRKEILNKLSNDESTKVRSGIFANNKTPADLFKKLSKDKNLEVLEALTKKMIVRSIDRSIGLINVIDYISNIVETIKEKNDNNISYKIIEDIFEIQNYWGHLGYRDPIYYSKILKELIIFLIKDKNSTAVLRRIREKFLTPAGSLSQHILTEEEMRKLKSWIDSEIDERNVPD